MKKIVCIVGPTASGKSALGITLAQRFGGEVVSADSRMVYRGMEVGTAVPKGNLSTRPAMARLDRGVFFEVESVPHHLIGIVEPNEPFTVVDWRKQAIAVMKNIHARGKLPIVVGGTGFYISALVNNLNIPPVVANELGREEIEKEIESVGVDRVAQRLVKLDPDAAQLVDLKNSRRVARALEVCLATGKPFTKQWKKGAPLYDALMIGIAVEKEELERRIRQRLEEQFGNGLLAEARRLKERYGCSLAPMQGFIYKELCQYLGGEISLERAKELIVLRNRQYAKRQMTWLRRDKRIQWISKLCEAIKILRQA